MIHRPAPDIGLIAAIVLLVMSLPALPADTPPGFDPFEGRFDPQAIWEAYSEFSRAPEVPANFRHADLERWIAEFVAESDGLFTDEVFIHSEEGRAIHHLSFGHGPTSALIWARQHGDEPLCSVALMDFLGFLADRRESEIVQTIAESLTLHIVPMVNPDGVERFTRRNASGIDPNRDGRLRQSQSGRALRQMWERFNPAVCFNLHDQEPRKSTSDTGDLIALSFQACPFDVAETMGPHLRRAKQLCGLMEHTLSPWIEGHMARYEANYMARAFGDSMSRWGVSAVLIETGGWYGPLAESEDFVTRCHFLALLTGVFAVATNAQEAISPERYDRMPLEGRQHFDLLVRDALILNGTGLQPQRGDIGINRQVDHRAGGALRGTIRDIGDMSIYSGREEIEGAGLVVTPGLIAIDPEFTPSDLGDRERVRSYLRRGITTVVGTGPAGEAALDHQPTEDVPIRALFLEPIADLAQAAERDFLTEARGMSLRFPSVRSEALATLEGTHDPLSLHLILINRGRVSENRGFALVGPAGPGEPLTVDEGLLSRAFGQWSYGVTLGSQSLDDPLIESQGVLLLSASPGAPGLPALVQATVGSERWTPSGLIGALTWAPAHALGLENLGRIWSRESADLVLWECRAGGVEEPEVIGLGDLRHGIVGGFEVPLD
jgi:Zinc carboxypeptidase